MQRPDIHCVIAVALDGLRPDAIEQFQLANLRRLGTSGASILHARTVSPSLTWPAIASFLTGVSPADHGILSEAVRLPRSREVLTPLPELLLRHGLPSSAFLTELPFLHRTIGARIAERVGFGRARFQGVTALEVLDSARGMLRAQRKGLIYLHLFDADRAGHAHGWMSDAYGAAARTLDDAVGQLVSCTLLQSDPHTLLVLFADHGGGGLERTHHEGDHPLNMTIPVILAGGAVEPLRLQRAHLLDLPATIAWALGAPVPRTWAGRVLSETFPHVAATIVDQAGSQSRSAVATASAWPMTTSPG